ncbi:MAG TPA: NAD-dependent malic enzyme [Polyangiaceae bacterium]|jgi:malate dehydrogenase (oxaloacetate-decarboxylating)|nr:NAD-dependent malic enzyme [Polyangiaceae bacterium]
MPKLSKYFETTRDDDGVFRMHVSLDGYALLRLAPTNKGTAFTMDERRALKLDGLLPPHVSSMDEQISRTYAGFIKQPNDLAKYTYLRAMQERNETLFYALLEHYLPEMLPIIYTPTVGDAVRNYHNIYQSARGLSLSPENIDRAGEVLHNCHYDDVRMIVATDSSAILGIGDQGYGGVAISIGKLSLYTAGGMSPWRSLPVGLDVGTERADLLEDPRYLGVRQKRLRGEEYFAFFDRFVDAVSERYPDAVLQWEDLSKDSAFAVHERYRKRLPSFNDDIQGTGAVTLAGVLSACQVRGDKLRDQRIVIFGAGAGGAGVAWELVRGMVADGLTEKEAMERMFLLDSKGLLSDDRPMEDYKLPFAKSKDVLAKTGKSLLEVVERTKATCLLGLSGQPGTFTEKIVRAMGKNTERPIVFALSNPTTSCEAQPADILAWTAGRAIVATGSPFQPVSFGGKLYEIGQGNNAFIFPGLGFGAVLSQAREITDKMVMAAAMALTEYTAEHHLAQGLIYPPVTELREVAAHVAARVITQAFEDGVARAPRDKMTNALDYVRTKMWQPKYLPFIQG